MWLGIGGFVLAAFALSFCAYLWFLLRDKVSEKDISSALQRSSEELNKTYEKSFRGLESEWVDMYAKFMRIAGRVDKTKGLDAVKEPAPVPVQQSFLRRSDLLRNKNGRKHDVQTLPIE